MAVLRGAREEAGLTQRQLAERIGVAQSLIGRLETGERNLAVTELIAIAGAIGVPAGELLRRIEAHLG